MEEKLKSGDKQVLLVISDEADGKGKVLKAVTGMDEDGKPTTISPHKDNRNSFLEIDPNRNVLENFFKKFLEQSKNPSHTGFFLVSEKMLNKIIKINPIQPEQLEPFRIEPQQFLMEKQHPVQEQTAQPIKQQQVDVEGQKPAFEPFDEKRIDFSHLERLGVNREDVEPNLKAMLYGYKSPHLIPMNPVVEGVVVPTKGRLSLEETPDGTLRFAPHYVQNKLDLDVPFHGVLLTLEDKEQLLKTGNAGRVITLEPVVGEKIPAFVAIDKLTNRLEALPLDKVNIPEKIKGVELSPQQQSELGEGKKVLVEGMTSRSDSKFDAYLQINASRKAFDFTYDGLDRNRYRQQENKPEQGQERVRIPQKLLGVELSSGQQEMLRENKAIYIKGMVKDDKNEPFNAYVKINLEKGKLDFFKWNPDRAKKQDQEKSNEQQNQTNKKPVIKKVTGIKM